MFLQDRLFGPHKLFKANLKAFLHCRARPGPTHAPSAQAYCTPALVVLR